MESTQDLDDAGRPDRCNCRSALVRSARARRNPRRKANRAGDVRVRALCGALSRGTERLVLAGHVPASEFERMRAPFMGGNFPFPVKYGYSTVGSVEAGPADLEGRIVFALYPHQTLFNVPSSAVVRLPNSLPPTPRCACREHGNRSQRGLGRRARASRPYRYCRCRRGWRLGGVPL